MKEEVVDRSVNRNFLFSHRHMEEMIIYLIHKSQGQIIILIIDIFFHSATQALFIFKCLFYICVCRHVNRCQQRPERVSYSLELEIQEVVSHWWMLVTELRSPGGAASSLTLKLSSFRSKL